MHRLGLEATRIGCYDNKEEAADDYSCAIFIYEGGIVIGGVHTINDGDATRSQQQKVAERYLFV